MAFHPVLTLLVAGALQGDGFDAPRPADLAAIAIELAESFDLSAPAVPDAEAEPTVRDVPFYYARLQPVRAVPAPVLVTYDWRSPVVFDVP